MPEITLRFAEEKDLPAVSRQVRDGYRAAYRGLMRDDYLEGLEEDHWVKVIGGTMAQGGRCLLALRGEEIVGSAVFGPPMMEAEPGDAEFFALYLLPEYTGQGIGSRLFAGAEQAMREMGYTGCVLEVLRENTGARALYERLGYAATRVFDVEENDMVLHCIVMRREWGHTPPPEEGGDNP